MVSSWYELVHPDKKHRRINGLVRHILLLLWLILTQDVVVIATGEEGYDLQVNKSAQVVVAIAVIKIMIVAVTSMVQDLF